MPLGTRLNDKVLIKLLQKFAGCGAEPHGLDLHAFAVIYDTDIIDLRKHNQAVIVHT